MAFMTLNGQTIDIADQSASFGTDEIARNEARTLSGSKVDSRTTIKRRGEFTTTYLTEDEGEALRHLLLGEGWHFPFDSDLYSEDTLLGPIAGYTATLGTSTPSPVYGAKRIKVPSGTTISFNVALTGSYTLMGNVYVTDEWDIFVKIYDASTSTTTVWEQGAPGSTVATMDVSSTHPRLLGKSPAGVNGDTFIDDFVVLPWAATSTQAIAWMTRAAAFSAIPKLDLDGDVLREGGPIEVRAKITDDKFHQVKIGSTWYDNARQLKFILEEV
jgi:hypothetical protein